MGSRVGYNQGKISTLVLPFRRRLKPPPGSTTAAEPDLRNDSHRVNLNKTKDINHPKNQKHIERFLIDFDLVDLDSGFIGDEIHATLTLFLLEFKGNSANGTPMDPFHQMGGEPGDLIAEPLGWDDGNFFDDLLVGVEIECHARVVPLNHLMGRFLHCSKGLNSRNDSLKDLFASTHDNHGSSMFLELSRDLPPLNDESEENLKEKKEIFESV
ncbi:hypothetical protein F3Y22_tig00110733pilonHSYRG00068 [Hibiscus syriacus]|uniref:Uncharacterized protein n=1 Tax=Hibiscus syriacus TaxID=106335 RepID=A0A6A2ZUA3_HIBSY|nr:hypothetical protein F3Y22_tig00110733pilonHSYRG00068 [Hibiscus syriacus]